MTLAVVSMRWALSESAFFPIMARGGVTYGRPQVSVGTHYRMGPREMPGVLRADATLARPSTRMYSLPCWSKDRHYYSSFLCHDIEGASR